MIISAKLKLYKIEFSLIKLLFLFLSIILFQCKSKQLDVENLQNSYKRQEVLSLTIFEFQKNWNNCIRDWDIAGTEYFYINELNMGSTPKGYGATALITDKSGFDIIIAATLNKQTNQIKEIALTAQWPDDPLNQVLLFASCGNLLRSIFPNKIEKEPAVDFAGEMLKDIINNKKEISRSVFESTPITLIYSNNLFAFTIGIE